jgi:hypothetical protein
VRSYFVHDTPEEDRAVSRTRAVDRTRLGLAVFPGNARGLVRCALWAGGAPAL